VDAVASGDPAGDSGQDGLRESDALPVESLRGIALAKISSGVKDARELVRRLYNEGAITPAACQRAGYEIERAEANLKSIIGNPESDSEMRWQYERLRGRT
jgi:hypothetical protein